MNFLSDFQFVGFSSVHFDFEIGMLLYDGLQPLDKRIKRLTGIGLLWPESIADLCLSQHMR